MINAKIEAKKIHADPAPGARVSVTIRDILAVGFRHRRLAQLSFLGVFLGAILSSVLMPNQYESHMKLQIRRERPEHLVSAGAETPSSGLTEEQINSEVEILRSHDLLEKVVLECGLDRPSHPSWLLRLRDSLRQGLRVPPERAKQMRVAEAVRLLESKSSVEPVKKTNLIQVNYESPDPQLSAHVLSTLAGLYLEKHLAIQRPPGVVDFFQQEAGRYFRQMGKAKARLSSFSQKQGVIVPELEKEQIIEKAAEFEADRQQTAVRISETQDRISTLQSLLARTPSRQTTVVRKLDNGQLMQTLQSSLLSLELKHTEMLSRFGASHPAVQELEKDLEQTRAAIQAAEKSPLREETSDRDPTYLWVVSELTKAQTELSVFLARRSSLSSSIELYRRNLNGVEEKGMAQEEMARAAKEAEGNYSLFLRKEQEARISDKLDQRRMVNIAIAEAPTVPSWPSRPRLWLTLVLGTALAVVISASLTLAVDYLDPTFRSPEELRQVLNAPVFASIPKTVN